MSAHFLEELNPEQKEATVQTEGPVMILAGAGSGKTRVLTYRIAYLMEKGIDPFRILALTFTNKAAREMKGRIGKLVGEHHAKALWMGTFHSVFSKILRFEAEKLGYPKNFTIYDTDDSKSLIRDILKFLNLDDKVYKPSLVLNRISSSKNNLISWQQYSNNTSIQAEDRSSQKPLLGKIYETFQKRLFKAGAMDFDDLLYNTNVLLRDFPDMLVKYQDKFRYILVDEYQDTNFSQYVIIKQLAARFENLCVVGDDAQSIYAFRGANIQNILNFKKDYPDVKTFKLEQNYRSTKTIVSAANKVISNNKEQFKKDVWTNNDQGEKIKVIRAASDNEEGFKVANLIFEEKMKRQMMNSEFAILYRTNAQSRAMEEALRKKNIPYRIYGGLSFYQRKEIKDLLCYFRLVVNNNDDESLRRIINYPARGIGQTTIDKIAILSAENDVSLWTVIDNMHDFNPGINAGTKSKINDFVTMIKTFSMSLFYTDAFEMANRIAVGSGILKDLYSDKTPEGAARYENIQELLNGIKEFSENDRTPQESELKDDFATEMEKNPGDLFAETVTTKEMRSLDEFMQEITLLTDADKNEKEDANADKVSLMTIHAAKGLEFPYVFVVGLEENLFPSQLSLTSRAELEEERRLFYVALTRAEKQAIMTYANTRYRYGNLIFCEPSRFIEELDPALIDFPDANNNVPAFNADVFDRYKQETRPKQNQKIEFKKPNTTQFKVATKSNLNSIQNNLSAASPIDADSIRKVTEGAEVIHEKFGQGKVLAIEGDFPNLKATIIFQRAGQKQLLLKYAKLEVMDK